MSVSGQTRLLVAQYGLIVALVLALFGVASIGGAAQIYLNPPSTQITEETNVQQFTTSMETSAVVENGTALYDEGDVLRNMPVYFSTATPNVNLHFKTEVPDGQAVTVSKRAVIVLRGVRSGQSFYESRQVVTAAKQDVSDGVLWSNTTLNMSDVRQDISEKRSAIGGVGTLQVTLQLNTSYESNQYSGTLTSSSPIVFTGGAYWFANTIQASDTRSTPESRTETESPNLLIVGGLAVLGLLLLIGAILVLYRYRSIDFATVETQLVRSRYDEWISNGEIPTKSGKEYIRTDSLEDLVDVAIDSNSRVIYDSNLDAYAVVQGDIVYYYTTEDVELTDWFDV